MKKIIALILSVMMLSTAFCALAEETKLAPLYATIGDALKEAGDNPVTGGEEDYYAVITEKDGKYYRSIAELDEKAKALQAAISEADADHLEEAFQASSDYLMTLPIAYSEEFTVFPKPQAEIEALVGKTIGDLRDAGYEEVQSGTDSGADGKMIIVYGMSSGLFDYLFEVDADFAAYEKAQEEWPDGGKDFVVKSAKFQGIDGNACYKRYHTDGTVEEIPDPLAGYAEIVAAFMEKIEAVRKGETVDIDAFAATLREQYPDLAEVIDAYADLFKEAGAEGMAKFLTSPEE